MFVFPEASENNDSIILKKKRWSDLTNVNRTLSDYYPSH